MQLKSLALLSTILSASSIANAQLTADDIAANLDKIRHIEKGTTYRIFLLSPERLVIDAPMALNGLREVINLISGDIRALSDGGVQTSYSEEDQEKICGALHDFAVSNGKLFADIEDKKFLLKGTPFVAPFSDLLILLKEGFDRLTSEIITTVPTCAADSQNAVKNVDEAFHNAISILT
ncbi:Fc.00g072370.m01.CDS01 [Cosmosporella sp. VM-42]